MDFYSFKEFLIHLSRITQLDLQLWDTKGLVFSSSADEEEVPFAKELRDLSNRIIHQSSFQHVTIDRQRTMFGVPLKEKEKIVGSLIAYVSNFHKSRGFKNSFKNSLKNLTPGETSYAEEMEPFLTSIAGLMEEIWAAQRESEEMAEEISQYFEDLSLYGRISTQIRTLKFSGETLRALLEDLLETMRVELAFVKMPERHEYNVLVSTNTFSQKIPDQDAFVDSLLNAIPEDIVSSGHDYFIVNDSRTMPGYRGLTTDSYRFLAVNIRHNNTFDGWLGLVSFNLKEIFRQSELRLLHTMAMQISVLMANLDLYHDLERFVVNMVKALVFAIEAKDTYTRGHSERVNRYCMLMAERLNLTEKKREAIRWASILHDIGKIGIPESVLNKPGPLDDEEYGVIKGHPQKGINILKPLVEHLSSSIPAIMHHHERYDGKGYPSGLKGENTPLFARIIAIADTFDAINSSRAYRPAGSRQKAMEIIEKVAGTQLDPVLVNVFREVYEAEVSKEPEEEQVV